MMRGPIHSFVRIFGSLVSLVGMEHGLGEVLQGDVRPAGIFIRSWPDSPWFRIENGEPAMTIVPNMLASGILTILVSLVFLVVASGLARRRRAGLALVGISIASLLVGGGFGPPLLGIITGLTAMKIGKPLLWWRTKCPPGMRRMLSRAWPFSLATCMGAFLMLVPGLPILARFGIEEPALLAALIPVAFGFLALTVVTSLAREAEGREEK